MLDKKKYIDEGILLTRGKLKGTWARRQGRLSAPGLRDPELQRLLPLLRVGVVGVLPIPETIVYLFNLFIYLIY